MITYLGNITLLASLCFAIFQIIIFNRRDGYLLLGFKKLAVNGLLFGSAFSFFSLMYGYVISDFSLLNVYQNSHTTKPFIYKISGVWGNHEGSMLLWILVLTIFNFFIFKLYDRTNYKFISKTLEIQGFLILGFLLFTFLTSNPFEKMNFLTDNGLGFNPILQDPALAIHPPLLYIGYVGFSAAFSMGVATLSLKNNQKIPWFVYMKPFVVSAWSFLTIGIAFGSIWAYYELGWGGWWFWDPVENASLMPWLLGTALLHSLITVNKKNSLQSWVLLLSILTFLFSVFGTFLVRSGILTSVHAFALDSSRGIYILIFTALLGCYSLLLFGTKVKNYSNKNYLPFLSRGGFILINNIFMLIVCATVFLGTIYPLLIEAITKNKISVGEPYYNSTVIPIIIPAILLMGIGPILSWEKENILKIFKKIYPKIFLTLIATITVFLFYQSYSFFGIIGITLSFWIIFNNLPILNKENKNHSLGMIVAHLGIGFLILGITGSSVWQKETIVKMQINTVTKIHKYNVIFKKIDEIRESNYYALRGSFFVIDKNKNLIANLEPENRYYPITNNFTTEASIHTNLFRDIYIVLGEGNINDGWVIKIYYNPLVVWIWIGALTVFLGGIITVIRNLKKMNYLMR